MPIQTKLVYGISAFDSILPHTGFELTYEQDQKRYVKYFDDSHEKYISFENADSRSGNKITAHGENSATIDIGYGVGIQSKCLWSCVTGENFLCLYGIGAEGFPVSKRTADNEIGILLEKGKNILTNEDQWFVCLHYFTNSLDSEKCINPYHFMEKIQEDSCVMNYNTAALITRPIIGNNLIRSQKVSSITSTPEAYIGSVGWVTVNGKEYYKNGVFLIDTE